MKTIKTLGLAVIAALALFAVPSVASASGGIEASSYPAKYLGHSTGTQSFSLSGGPQGEVSCPEAFMSGTASGPVGTLPMSTYMECNGNTLNMNGCKFELHPGSENTVDIGPPGCGPIKNLYISSCEIRIPSQTGIPATFTNTVVGGRETVEFTVSSGLKSTRENCIYNGELLYTGKWEIVGTNELSNPLNIRTKDGFNGLFIAGKKSEEEAKQPKFEAEKYPNPITGSLKSGKITWTMPGVIKGTLNCSAAQYSAQATKASSTLPITATISDCMWEENAATIAMHSCYFNFGVSNVNVLPPVVYGGTVGVGCSTSGDSIEIVIPECTITIGAQNPTSSTPYWN